MKRLTEDMFPPCIKTQIKKEKNEEKKHLIGFLFHVGWDVEQIKRREGLVGKNLQEYLPKNCSQQSYCKPNDHCKKMSERGVGNPLIYALLRWRS